MTTTTGPNANADAREAGGAVAVDGHEHPDAPEALLRALVGAVLREQFRDLDEHRVAVWGSVVRGR